MTTTIKQVKLLMKNIKKYTQATAAAKSGMDVKTARKYLNRSQPAELLEPHTWRTRINPFEDDWSEIVAMLKNAPGLQAKTIFDYLLRKRSNHYKPVQLRALQRHIQGWRAEHGKDKAIIFCQNILPGKQSQSDFTNMNSLEITIANVPFKHLLFHFMLPYSKWESVMICFSETFDNLTFGYEKAVWELGFVAPEHRTDNLSAAITAMGNRLEFTNRWQHFMAHYKVTPTTNNPGESHENGSVEKSHDTLKISIEQHLLLRGYRDFSSRGSYTEFLKTIIVSRNLYRKKRLEEEINKLKLLPESAWHAPQIFQVRVSPSSIVQILGIPYSVPSRLISYNLKAYIYPEEILLFYGKKKLQRMKRIHPGEPPLIDYRHIIDSLIRKPGAFANYQYREALFPRLIFRQTYDKLKRHHPAQADKKYLKLLQFCKLYSEQSVTIALELLHETNQLAEPEDVKELIAVYQKEKTNVMVSEPNLMQYDSLLKKASGNLLEGIY